LRWLTAALFSAERCKVVKHADAKRGPLDKEEKYPWLPTPILFISRSAIASMPRLTRGALTVSAGRRSTCRRTFCVAQLTSACGGHLNRTKNNLRGSRPYDCKGVRLSLGALFHLPDLRDVPAEQPAAMGALIRQPSLQACRGRLGPVIDVRIA
jgi:hypothetical protein